MSKKKIGQRFIRRNLSFPEEFGPRLERVRLHTGATSDSEVIRMAFVDYEAKLNLPSIPAILHQQQRDKKK